MRRLGLLAGVLVLVAAAAVVGAVVLAPHLRGLRLPRIGGAPKPVLVAVPAITTNLAGPAADHFAQVAFTLKLRDPALAKVFAQRQAAVLNAVIGDIRREPLSALGGAAGMHTLAQLISASLDGVLGQPRAVLAVFFTQFVVQ
jgi:flagellar basal body-associated protein FliL